MTEIKTRKKLIEVALPLDAINTASAREKSIRHGHPSTLHLWWARRPLAAARAVIFAQMVDDPSSHPERFPTSEEQDAERQRLFGIIEELVVWENTTNEEVLEKARAEIRRSWRWTCEDNKDHPQAAELFDPERLPAFHDPFAGGGSLPLEAQRLGLEAHATDLNPVAVLINKAMIEFPPKFAGRPPVNPESRKKKELLKREWRGAAGLAEDVRYYGKWMRDEAEKRIGHLYPKVKITHEMVVERPDLEPYRGRELTVIAWIWARTVRSPNPAFAEVEVPLASTFMLSAKDGQEAWVDHSFEAQGYRFRVRVGRPDDAERARSGTKLGHGANFRCLMSGSPIGSDYIQAEAQSRGLGQRLMAVIAQADRKRIYLSPTDRDQTIAACAKPAWKPDVAFMKEALGFRIGNYGMSSWDDLFTHRQLATLSALTDIVREVPERVLLDAKLSQMEIDGKRLRDHGLGATAYSDAVAAFLAFAVDKTAEGSTTICTWSPLPTKLHVVSTFGRQALPMTWDFAEANVFADSSGNIQRMSELVSKVVEAQPCSHRSVGWSAQGDAQRLDYAECSVISTDPPYYDNIGYADLSDFFYVWLRRSLRDVFPDLFATVSVPKAEELVATPHRHGGRRGAEAFFVQGMTEALTQLSRKAVPALPVTIYYAFKQAESQGQDGVASTGWETFLEAAIGAGLSVGGTWPVRAERSGGFRNQNRNSLASSIVLVCRQRAATAPAVSRRDFMSALGAELPKALAHLQRCSIAPVDLAQAAIGPGMAVFTRYSRVIESDGSELGVRAALALINRVLDESLAEQEGDFDGDTRWALAWFDEHRFGQGDYGKAETLSTARNTSVRGIEEAGILVSKAGKVRLLKPSELPEGWDPASDSRLTTWECVHHLIRVLESEGETAAAALAAKMGPHTDAARELAYRLYTICERKNWSAEAKAYNGLVVSWSAIESLLGTTEQVPPAAQKQQDLPGM